MGALLVGDIPYVYQHLTFEFPHAAESVPPRRQENISMQYYMDLDGEFLQTERYQPVNGKDPRGEPMFNIHRG